MIKKLNRNYNVVLCAAFKTDDSNQPACEWDYDGDWTANEDDVCPYDSAIETVDFTDLLEVPLASLTSNDSRWHSSEQVSCQQKLS